MWQKDLIHVIARFVIYNHFKVDYANSDTSLAFGAVEREVQQNCIWVSFGMRFCSAEGTMNPMPSLFLSIFTPPAALALYLVTGSGRNLEQRLIRLFFE